MLLILIAPLLAVNLVSAEVLVELGAINDRGTLGVIGEVEVLRRPKTDGALPDEIEKFDYYLFGPLKQTEAVFARLQEGETNFSDFVRAKKPIAKAATKNQ